MADQTSEVLVRSSSWFVDSGIQEPGGGVARYYRLEERCNAGISNEITGYAASALAFAHQRLDNPRLLHGLVNAALFLSTNAWDQTLGVFPFETPRDGEHPCRLAYFFDTGIIVRGLLAAWRSTRERRFLKSAVAGAQSMADHFLTEEVIHPVIGLPDKTPLPTEPRWSRSPGCYHLKAALAWLQLHEETGQERFRDAWEECLDLSLAAHESFLPGEPDHERVMDRLHAYCYFLEGLLAVTNRQPCVRALSEGMERVEHYLRQIEPLFARSDVYAQLLRLRLYAASTGAVSLNQTAAAHEAEAARAFEFTSQDPLLKGCFSFGKKQGKHMPFANPVSTAFCMEALTLWAQRHNQQNRLNWRELI